MKDPVKIAILAVVAVGLVVGAFWAGTAYEGATTPAGLPGTGDAQGLRGGAMASLTAEEQAELQSMSPEERQAFLQEKVGTPTAGVGMGGPLRGGNLEGEVIEVAGDTITMSVGDSGSQTVYTDENTVVAYVEGADALAAGAEVIVIAQPAADGVATASLVVVR